MAEKIPDQDDDRQAWEATPAPRRSRPSDLFSLVATRLHELVKVTAGTAGAECFDCLLDQPRPARTPWPPRSLQASLDEWQRLAPPGGWLAFSSYREQAFEPALSLYVARLRKYAVLLAPETLFPWQHFAYPETIRGLLRRAGLNDIRVYTEHLRYRLTDPGDRWDILSNSALSALLARLPPAQLEFFRAEHLAEVSELAGDPAVWLDLPVLMTMGRVPAHHRGPLGPLTPHRPLGPSGLLENR